ncbi:MAG: hypothetical protein A2309_14750 [Bacteroidetes bacterium RIFOXYB2_FULL_35_7]|nr:MAG: hypothetical protein A2309_14750 [Bacteroidetes bacterium RIFOXYB2_FULL_35_7]HBX51721.1 hypothetical protein [Bacteroidales bacterium]
MGFNKCTWLFNVQIDIKKQEFLPGDSVLLASDGFYEGINMFENEITGLSCHSDIEKGLQSLFACNEGLFNDDASAIFIRRK